MPEKRICGTFSLEKEIDKSEYIHNKIEEARSDAYKELDEALKIGNRVFSLICMFSVVDSFAQEYANYPSRNATNAFCDFVMKFQDYCDYLGEIEPVTLFYEYEPKIKLLVRHPELKDVIPELCRPELEISLDDFGRIDEQYVSNVVRNPKVKNLLSVIERDQKPKTVDKYKINHTFIRLIYKMRSKAVHELGFLGLENKWDIEEGRVEPFYRDVSRMYVFGENIVSDNVYELIIPNMFIYNLAKNTITNYLNFCLENNRLPYDNNNHFIRSVSVTWTD